MRGVLVEPVFELRHDVTIEIVASSCHYDWSLTILIPQLVDGVWKESESFVASVLLVTHATLAGNLATNHAHVTLPTRLRQFILVSVAVVLVLAPLVVSNVENRMTRHNKSGKG